MTRVNSNAPVITGNYWDKYNAKNPAVRWIMANFKNSLLDLLDQIEFNAIFEVGCGEGYLASWVVRDHVPYHGCDIGADVIEQARSFHGKSRNMHFFEADLFDLNTTLYRSDLVICCEVLEHVQRPEAALDILSALSSKYLIVSVPREPIWRLLNILRGRYLRDLGNTPGHIQHWSRTSFLKFLATKFEIVEVKSPLPWTMVLLTVI